MKIPFTNLEIVKRFDNLRDIDEMFDDEND